MSFPPKIYEEEAVILDFLPEGYAGKRGRPIALAIGVQKFTLLELAPTKNVLVALREIVSIHPDNRGIIDHVIQRIKYSDLTNTAENELEGALNLIVTRREQDFVAFFNEAEHVNIRLHRLELLPGVGNKLMWEIINARKIKSFTDFNDISERTHIGDPKKIIIKRIRSELQGNEKYYLFTRKAKTEEASEQPPPHKTRYTKAPPHPSRGQGRPFSQNKSQRGYKK